jgi:hypothetical protein
VTETAIPINTVVEDYFAMWNETDGQRRQKIIAGAWTPDAAYSDPLFTASGAEGLDVLVAGVHQQYPGHRFRLTGAVESHHDRARWGWELAGPDGAMPVARGVDFAVLTADGRLREVTGFFEPVAATA